ncbi:MAG TPA: DUF1800 domain-containing protein [Niabella sp.]|nr:DUF1800 domain-containing protein [Niabella sp.]HQW15461.1 DUF1800 domain-containing protein [Niabella sp.]HQX20603.1 DUF1800 domain-containing protein [Niabella sp.]HRB07007.1 DUF1800 domain-containing protein [Niabella sp.]HRB35813.1 DUF1800 domain-containing protein [Niabella sp.]
MEISNQLKNQHLMWRAGFGPAAEQLNDLDKYSPAKYFKALAKASANEPVYINVASNNLISAFENLQDAGKRKNLDEMQRREINRMMQAAVKDLNLYWLKEMISTGAQLREKMAFFWHGHFATRERNIFHTQLLLQVFRKHGLGSFRNLLKEVSQSAAMINFLNNQQNRKGHPNENFAREVMELFTLGRGNYTETDIKEAARAFTGWTANGTGDFVFRNNFHDDGNKTVLGKSGRLTGDDILNIILENRQTSRFIVQKIYCFFVNDIVDDKLVNQLADKFYNSNYDIGNLMETIFTSDWFYSMKNIGARIKSPVELLAGIQRMIPMTLENDTPLLNLQKILGQQLLYPPNVAGWPGGKAWIDSSTLMMRLRIPQMFNDKDELNVAPKQDDDTMMGQKTDGTAAVPGKEVMPKKRYGAINAKINWAQYTISYDKVKRENLLDNIRNNLFQVNASNVEITVNKDVDASSREAFIKSATIQLMSTPEYQLC